MKLTLLFTLLAVSSTFSWHINKRRELPELFEDESLPSIVFTADWKENVHGELGVGRDFKIIYNAKRLKGSVDVEYKFNDGPEYKSESLGKPVEVEGEMVYLKTLSIPVDAKKVVMWFKSGNNYDSDFGQNYHFAITRPSIVFDKNWGETAHGKLKRGDSFELFYDSNRLKVGAKIIAGMLFDDKAVEQPLEANKDSVYQTAKISIPKDAKGLQLWFYYEDKNGDKQYDSDFGKNYHFELSNE